MSFVAVGGDGSARPTFFELIAAERLMPSLKAAVIYSISVRTQDGTLLVSYNTLEAYVRGRAAGVVVLAAAVF